MEHVWSVLCRLQITDKDRNSISLIETTDQINFFAEENVNVEGIPAQLVIVSMWWRSHSNEPEMGYQRMLISSPKGEVMVTSSELEIDLITSGRARIIINVDGLPFTGDGIYRFIIQYSIANSGNWVDAASVPLMIVRDAVSRFTNEG
ncbi:MAG: hypothetical protein GC179_10765 [Anaerolineaceae bacterium]|nr:hypothetical protein [Anaerolineaceae bacterium]